MAGLLERVFLIGSSGHASVLLDILEKQGVCEVVGIIDSFTAPGSEALGLTVLGAEADIRDLMARRETAAGIIGIGDNFVRSQVAQRILDTAPDFRFVSAIHPSAQIARGARIGCGSAVMAGAVIGPNTVIEQHCIVNTRASIDHDNILRRFSTVGPGAVTGGNVELGEFGVIALSAGVLHGRRVGAHAVLGAGAIATRDIPDFAVAYGTPARVVRMRNAGDKYL
jgi:sugar O-acyltransferase (sialic acid O-acetyltransferase NeuD family)